MTVRNWVRLRKYCADVGDTPQAVHARRKRRQWIDGIHCRVGPDGNLWVCPEEINRWVQGLPPLEHPPESSVSRAA